MSRKLSMIVAIAMGLATAGCQGLLALARPPITPPSPQAIYEPAVVTTVAGSIEGFADGVGAAAQFRSPRGLALDASGSLWVSDSGNFALRRVDPSGLVSTVAGHGVEGFHEGVGRLAGLPWPFGLARTSTGDFLLAAGEGIVSVSPTGTVASLAGGAPGSRDGRGAAAEFKAPLDVAVSASGDVLVLDHDNGLRRLSPAGEVSTMLDRFFIAGRGFVGGAHRLAFEPDGNVVVACYDSPPIVRVDRQGVCTLVGDDGQRENLGWTYVDGPLSTARFRTVADLAVDAAGNIFVIDVDCVRKIGVNGQVTTLAGTPRSEGSPQSCDGVGPAARFMALEGIEVDPSGCLWVLDGNLVRKVQPLAPAR